MEVQIPRSRVWVGNVNPGKVAWEFTESLTGMAIADKTRGWNVFAGLLGGKSGSNISKARNEIVARFLDETDGEWLLWLDSDMVFPPEVIVRLLAAAQAADTKIIGGLCVMVTDDGPIPTLYMPATGANDVTRVMLYAPDDRLLQVAATGAACLLVHRSVYEAIREASPGDRLYPWFQERVINTRWVSEDIVFCLRAQELGCRVFVDCTLSIGHVKNGRVWRAADIDTGIGVPPAKTVAIIPVKDRLGLTTDLVHQLREQGCDEIIICDNGSGTNTRNWLDSQDDLTVIDCPDVGIHTMWNRGVSHAVDKHGHRVRVAILNNDLRLGDGFLARMGEALDSGSPWLVAVSGNYDGRTGDGLVEEVTDICAGRYDGTGGLAGFAFMCRGDWFTSGYRFPEECMWWYGDNDLMAAIAAGGYKAGIALRARVEHLDGGGQTAGDWGDDTYTAQLDADRKAYFRRWNKWDPQALAAGATA